MDDGTGLIPCAVWEKGSSGAGLFLKVGDCIRARGLLSQFRGELQLSVPNQRKRGILYFFYRLDNIIIIEAANVYLSLVLEKFSANLAIQPSYQDGLPQ